MVSQWELILRLIVATVLGAIIGYERHVHGRPAGLRTHLIVALASATFMVVSTHFIYFQQYRRDDLVSADTSRIAASVVAGIGFLAGGAILRTGLTVQGLTTAAGLWLVSAIGLAAGGGMYLISVVATGAGVIALTLVRRLEHKDDHRLRRKVSLVLDEGGPSLGKLLEAVGHLGAIVSPAQYERRIDERQVHIMFQARFEEADIARLLAFLEAQPGMRRVRLDLMSENY